MYHHIMKKVFSSKQKAVIALEAIKGVKDHNQLTSEYEVHPIRIGLWKKTILENAHILFGGKKDKVLQEKQDLIDRLYRIIGQRDTEIEWLKKKFHIDA